MARGENGKGFGPKGEGARDKGKGKGKSKGGKEGKGAWVNGPPPGPMDDDEFGGGTPMGGQQGGGRRGRRARQGGGGVGLGAGGEVEDDESLLGEWFRVLEKGRKQRILWSEGTRGGDEDGPARKGKGKGGPSPPTDPDLLSEEEKDGLRTIIQDCQQALVVVHQLSGSKVQGLVHQSAVDQMRLKATEAQSKLDRDNAARARAAAAPVVHKMDEDGDVLAEGDADGDPDGGPTWREDKDVPLWVKLRRSENREGRLAKKAASIVKNLEVLRELSVELAQQIQTDADRLRDIRADIRTETDQRLEWAKEMAVRAAAWGEEDKRDAEEEKFLGGLEKASGVLANEGIWEDFGQHLDDDWDGTVPYYRQPKKGGRGSGGKHGGDGGSGSDLEDGSAVLARKQKRMDRTQAELERQLAQVQVAQDQLRAREAELEAKASQMVAEVGAQAQALVQHAAAAVPTAANEMLAQGLVDKWLEANRRAAGASDGEAAKLAASISDCGTQLLGPDFAARLQLAVAAELEVGRVGGGVGGKKSAAGGPTQLDSEAESAGSDRSRASRKGRRRARHSQDKADVAAAKPAK